MKKFLMFFLVIICSFGLFSCNLADSENPQFEIYELAKKSGYNGTYEDWLNSIKGEPGKDGREIELDIVGDNICWRYKGTENWTTLKPVKDLVGPKGDKGDKGDKGSQGPKGDTGSTGKTGKSAYEIYKDAHPDYTKSEDEWLEDLVNGRLGDNSYQMVKEKVYLHSQPNQTTRSFVNTYYYHNGNVPYVGIGEFFELFKPLLEHEIKTTTSFKDKTVCYSYNVGTSEYSFKVDWKNDLIEVNDYRFFQYLFNPNDPDILPYLKRTGRTVSENVSVTFDLGHDGIDAIYHDSDLLLQPDVLSALFFSYDLGNFVYAGSSFAFFLGYGDDRSTNKFRSSMYNDSQMPWDLRKATMNGLVFIFNNYYGLRDFKKYDDFRDEIEVFGTQYHLQEKLYSPNYNRYTEGYLQFYYSFLDDPHTTLVSNSIYAPEKNFENEKNYYTERNQKLEDDYYATMRLYNKTFAPDELDISLNGYPVRYEGSTAFIRFDNFKISHTINSETWKNDTFYYVKHCLDLVRAYNQANNDAIKNVVLDITSNLGGVIITMQSIVGLITDEDVVAPTFNLHSGTEIIETYAVDADLDGDFTDKDAYSEFNYTILTSNASFSAGNYFPAIAKGMGIATIMGMTSGGGMCSVGTHSLLDGTVGKISSYNILAGLDSNGEFYFTDNGVTPDKEIAMDKFYDLAYINSLIEAANAVA